MRPLAALALAACGGTTPLAKSAVVDASIPVQVCSASFSSAFTATDSCAVSATYASAAQTWTLSTNGNIVPPTNETWTGVRATFTGMPATRTYEGSEAIGMVGELSDLSDLATPVWALSPTAGSLQATLTDLGPFVDLGGGNRLYSVPRGQIDATFVDASKPPGSAVLLAVTF